MPLCFAFLRAINVGGRNVKMDRLRGIFEDIGCESVQTHIASGNVIFQTRKRNLDLLAASIEEDLDRELGFEVTVFLRTAEELIQAASRIPFSETEMQKAAAFNVAFTGRDPTDEERLAVEGLATDIDTLAVRGREVYWICGRKQSETKLKSGQMERTLGQAATTRNVKTVRDIATKYAEWNGELS